MLFLPCWCNSKSPGSPTHPRSHRASEVHHHRCSKRRWPRLCWYFKQREHREACNSQEYAQTGSTVSSLRLIFTVVYLGFSCNLCSADTGTHAAHEHECTHASGWLKGSGSQWSCFHCFCCRQAQRVKFDPVSQSLWARSVRGRRVGGVTFWFSALLSAASDLSLSTADSLEERHVFVSHTVVETCTVLMQQVCPMMKLLLESCNRF